MKEKAILVVGLIFGIVNLSLAQGDQKTTATTEEAKRGTVQTNEPQSQGEAAAWGSAVKKGTVDAYLAFARGYPKSERIQIRTGTVRARYWYKIAMPFAQSQESASGVLVTVEGAQLLSNVSLEEAKAEGLLNISSATKGQKVDAKGQTFNWTCLEVTDGGAVVNNELIEPKDSKDATVIVSGDGKTLLAWDVRNAKPVAQPDRKPTYVELEANKAWLPKP